MIKSVLTALALAAATVSVAHAAPLPASIVAEAHLTIDSPIKDLLANPETAAILEKHMPGIADHPMRPQFEAMSLPQVAPMSQGQVTPEIIAAVKADLEALHAH